MNTAKKSVKTMPMQNESTVVRSKKGHYLRHEKMINENLVLSYFAALNTYVES